MAANHRLWSSQSPLISEGALRGFVLAFPLLAAAGAIAEHNFRYDQHLRAASLASNLPTPNAVDESDQLCGYEIFNIAHWLIKIELTIGDPP